MSGPETVPPSGAVHWIGTGLSTGTGLAALAGSADRLVVWGRTEDKARACLSRLGVTGRAEIRGLAEADLGSELGVGDVLVSMLPATEHLDLLRLCLRRRAHFACSSYVSEQIAATAVDAARAGIVILTEAGLDPGLDHLLAHQLVASATLALGGRPARVAFTSYCGGIPARPNEFRYRFSWAPRGVLAALLTPARYLDDGREQIADRPWEATSGYSLAGPHGEEKFEVYPNRDSLPFIGQYDIPSAWRLDTFVRGTLRLDGWRQAWAPVFDELRGGDVGRINTLADTLAARHPTTESDRDRVVLAVALTARATGGAGWSGEYVLDLVGDNTDSAMARCVSLTLACGIGEILAGHTAAGLHRAAEDPSSARRWLDFLNAHGIGCAFRQK